MLNSGSIFSHYKIDEVLGSGAMGVVYKATDNDSGETVALKLIDDSLQKSADYRKRLVEEAEAAAKINSPYIIKMNECSEFQDIPYLSLEYAHGKELREVMETFDFNKKIDIASQIGRGLKAAHSQSLIHRDLKPENIKVDTEGNVKILDFGLAKTVSANSVDKYGDIEGTLYYLSPEQITNDPMSFAADLFSFGVVLFEMLTGQRPFEGDYPAAIIYSILHEDPPVPSEIKLDIPLWADKLIMKLLDKRPENRYENIQVVLDLIQTSLAGTKEISRQLPAKSRHTLTIIDLKNLSGDKTWDYFCIGFTDDLMREISRRTNLVVSSEPASAYSRDIKEVFDRYRSDFVVIGSLMKWQEIIKLSLSIYGSNGEEILSGNNYETDSKDLFNIMTQAVEDTSTVLSQATGLSTIDAEDYFKTDIAAYEYYLKGKNYYQTNKPEDLQIAEEMFTKALQIDSELSHAYSGLSDVYSFQYMAYYDRSLEKIENARKQALKALEKSPNLPEAHRSLGRYYMFIGAMDSAEKSFLKSVEINPKYAIGYRTLAWLKELAGEHENAIFWAKKALNNAPNDLETLLLLGLSNMHLAKYTVALATLHRAIELAPDYGRAHYNLGRIYLKLGVLNQALESFTSAVTHKGDPNAYIDAAYVHLLIGNVAKARDTFIESIKAEFFPFIANYFLGYLEEREGNQPTAEEFYQNAADVAREFGDKDQDNTHVKAYEAMAEAGLGNHDKAEAILQKLDDYLRYDGEMLYNIARGYALLGNKVIAEKILRQALLKHPGPTNEEISNDPHFMDLRFDFDNV